MTDLKQKLIKGITVNMGGADYIIPPLNLDQVEELLPEINSFKDLVALHAMTKEQRDTLLKVTLAAMNRNYPEMTTEELRKLIDAGNALEVWLGIMGVSGLKKSMDSLTGMANR